MGRVACVNTIEILANNWRSSGVEPGGVLLVHSSLKRTLAKYPLLKPSDILESFLIAVGNSGTLLLPVFNFNFNAGKPFDITSTPSQMGALTEAARIHPKACRSGHPVYSFVAIGQQAEKFGDIDNTSGYGADSPFALLRQFEGQIAVLDLPDQRSMTFYHHVEEMCQVPYRYHKFFEAGYLGEDGQESLKRYSIFVRDLDQGVLTHVDPAGERLWKAGLYSGERPGIGNGLRVIGACAMFEFVCGLISNGLAENNLFRVEVEA